MVQWRQFSFGIFLWDSIRDLDEFIAIRKSSPFLETMWEIEIEPTHGMLL